MVWDILIILLVLFLPRLLMTLGKRPGFSLLGPVFLCYAAGILLSFVLPASGMAMTLSELLVPLAIPLILFSCNVAVLRKLARPMLTSFGLNGVAVIIAATLGFFIFRNLIGQAGPIAAMLTGLYTGGTPNMMAIGLALNVPSDTIVLANTADMIAGGVYFLLILSVGRTLLGRVLKPYCPVLAPSRLEEDDELVRRYMPEKQPLSLAMLRPLAGAMGLALACLAVSAGVALLLTGSLHVAVVMLGVTTLGVACSFNRRVRSCPGTYQIGQYLIYMFSLAIGLSFDLSALNGSALLLFALLLLVQFGAVGLHLLLCRWARVDRDTMIITSIAGIFGPAFIAPTAAALNNDEVLLPGLACGILGYGLGNYLGIGLGYLLAAL